MVGEAQKKPAGKAGLKEVGVWANTQIFGTASRLGIFAVDPPGLVGWIIGGSTLYIIDPTLRLFEALCLFGSAQVCQLVDIEENASRGRSLLTILP